MKHLSLLAGLAAIMFGQQLEEKSNDHKSYAGVRELIIDNISGSIEVTAAAGGSVEVEIARTLRADSQDRLTIARKELSLAERREGGLVQLMVDGPFRCHCSDNSINFRGRDLYQFTYDFKIRVPRDITLDLRTVNRSQITVEGTAGDFKISNVNGGIEMREIEGSGSVHTVNGPVKVSFARNPRAPTSFKSVNGTLDVTFRSAERRREAEDVQRRNVYRFSGNGACGGIHAPRARQWKGRLSQKSDDRRPRR